jgi:hypothetical protein
MRVGYSYWGFLGDVKLDALGKELSTPDGNATYSWSLIHEMQRRKWKVYGMQEDRDRHGWMRLGSELFSAFSPGKRQGAYLGMMKTSGVALPDLDVLLVEWRFPIPGRNTSDVYGHPEWQPDLFRQMEILSYYKQKKTRIIFWDLDHKLTEADEEEWRPDAVFETSCKPRYQAVRRLRVEPPIIVEDLLQFPTVPADGDQMVAYIGSRYERDEIIDRYLGDVQRIHPYMIHFYGKWEPKDELRARWPGIIFHDRCTVRDFRSIYQGAGCVPLLAKQSYLDTGFITPRPWEALLFGSIPLGLAEGRGVDRYVLDTARPGDDMVEAIETMAGLGLKERDRLRRENIEMISFMDARYFVDEIERVAR